MRITEKELRKEIKNGMSLYAIARKYKMSVSSVYERMKRYGLKANYRFAKDGGYKKEWRKLSRNNKCLSRIFSLPSALIREIGVDPTKELYGRWVVKDGMLVLEIKEEMNES